MKKVKIFLASSINEFKNERNEIGDLIRRMQDILIDFDIRINLFECEFFDNSIALGRKQEEYNREIEKSDIFIMLVGEKIGQYTLEEFNIAKNTEGLKINIIFEKEKSMQSDFVKKFKEDIIEIEKVNTYVFNKQIELKCIIAAIISNEINEVVRICVNDEKILIEEEEVKL